MAVDSARAADFDVVQTGAIDEVGRSHNSAGILVVGQHAEERAGIELQVDAAFHRERTAKKCAGWNFNGSTTGGIGGIDGVLNGGGVGCDSIAERAEVGDDENLVGNNRQGGICRSA